MSYGSNQYAKFPSFISILSPHRYAWDTQVQVHTCEELILFSRPGSCTVVNNGNTITVETPAFIWNRAGSYHYFPQISDPEDSFVATFSPQILSEMPKGMLKTEFLENSTLFILPLSEKHTTRLTRLFHSLWGSPYFQRQLLFPCIFHQVSQALAAGLEPIRFGNINDYIFQVIKLLQEVGPERLTTDSLAARFHVGKTKLNDDFKRIANVSVHAYRLEQQLRAARTKLASSKAPIVQIAIDCGFTDESHLIRAFRTRYGITPGAFRKKYMADFRIVQQHTQEYPSTT